MINDFLSQEVRYLKGVGPKTAQLLAKLNVYNVVDLLYYFPRAWVDFSKTTAIASAKIGQEVIIRAKVLSITNNRSFRKRMIITRVRLADTSGEITALWFSQPYLAKIFSVGSEWLFLGKVNYDWQAKEKTIFPSNYEKQPIILPVYPETEGLSSKYLRKIIKPVLTEIKLADFLPQEILEKEKLLDINNSLNEIHFPITSSSLLRAKARLSFEEMFLISLKVLIIKKELAKFPCLKIKINKILLGNFAKSLPYQLTNDQKMAAWKIINDLAKSQPMNRLLQGDVGSGKTVVAAMAALSVIKSGYRVVWMAPTEILAIQHYQTCCELLAGFGVNISLLTGSQIMANSGKAKLKKTEHKTLAQNSDLVIGTQAVIQDKVKFTDLGLVIIDEQHRFGVQQRAKLVACGSTRKMVPHFLSMTATPIPRSLSLTLYGHLDLSIIRELPKGRKKIITRLVDPTNREKAYNFIRQQVKGGRQAMVICPLIETTVQKVNSGKLFDLDRKTVAEEYKKLSQQIFPDLRVGMLHGKLKPEEKQQVMRDFSAGKIDLLVSTSVIEVGLDVPNASIIMIEDADRFGLAQLHQFRGRVGRSSFQSYCLLFTSSLAVKSNLRLKALVNCNDGFVLAEKDLEIRGPGELIGLAQSGLPDLKIAKISDIMLIKKARFLAEKILSEGLSHYPELLNKLRADKIIKHLE